MTKCLSAALDYGRVTRNRANGRPSLQMRSDPVLFTCYNVAVPEVTRLTREEAAYVRSEHPSYADGIPRRKQSPPVGSSDGAYNRRTIHAGAQLLARVDSPSGGASCGDGSLL